MPELPEVETVKTTLNELIAGKQIKKVLVLLARIIQRPDDVEQFCFLLAGQTFRSIERRGKFLRMHLDDYTLVSHLRMEGRYGVYGQEDPLEKHTHVQFLFTDGTELRYKDVRQFGTMHVFERGTDLLNPPLRNLGLEPLSPSFTYERFRKCLGTRKTKIKPFLLDQTHIVGLGNIYVDEALFQARIHPEKPIDKLKSIDKKRLYLAIVMTLQEAVKAGGTSVKSYVNGQGEMGMFQQQLMVYGKAGEPCVECGRPIEKTVVAGRGTHFCKKCQPYRKPKMDSKGNELSSRS